MATATILVVLLAAWWVLRWQGVQWRQTIWAEHGDVLTRIAGATQSTLAPCWTGYTLARGDRLVSVSGGIEGLCTRYRHGRKRKKMSGLDSESSLTAYLTLSI